MLTQLSIYLDFLIALVFSLAIGSTMLSILFEAYAYRIKLRAKFLRQTIDDVLNDSQLNFNYAEILYNQPQIDLTKKTYRHQPSYISSLNFSQAVINTIVRTHENSSERFVHKAGMVTLENVPDQDKIIDRFKNSVARMKYSDLKVLLTGFINTSDNDKEALVKNIGLWYDEYMNRVGGWYKIKAQRLMLVFGIMCCFSFNVDFFKVSHALLHDHELSKHVADLADTYTLKNKDKIQEIINGTDGLNEEQRIRQHQKDLQGYLAVIDDVYMQNAPVGWQGENSVGVNDEGFTSYWLKKISGCLLSAIAMAVGAPFWFDLLSKLVNLRSAGHKPDTLSSTNP